MTTDRAGQRANGQGMWPVPAGGPGDDPRRREHEHLRAQLLVSGQRAQQARRHNLAGPTNPRANQRIHRQLLELQSIDEVLHEGEPGVRRQPAQPSPPPQQQQQQQQPPNPQPVQHAQAHLPSPPAYVVAKVTIGNPTEALLRAEGVETRDFAVEAEAKKAEDQRKELVTIAEELVRQGVAVHDWAYPSVEVEREMRGAAIGVVVGEGEYLFGDDEEEEEEEGDEEERKGEEKGEAEEDENEDGGKEDGEGEDEGAEAEDIACSPVESEAQTKDADFGAVAGEGERRAWGEPEGEYQFADEVVAEIESDADAEHLSQAE
jgi:hypothetical protein